MGSPGRPVRAAWAVAAASLWLAARPASARDGDADPAADGEVVPARWLVLPDPDVRARRPFGPHAVFARYLLDRDAAPPVDGEEVSGERGAAVKWREVATKDGALEDAAAAVAYTTVVSDEDRVAVAQAVGASVLWVNGEPLVGDVYGYGTGGVPVALRKGENRVYALGLRGAVKVAFRRQSPGVVPASWDCTKPDVVPAGGPVDLGVLIVNSRPEQVVAEVAGDGAGASTRPVRLLPFSVAKVPVRGTPLLDEGGAGNVSVSVTAPSVPAGSVRQIPVLPAGADQPRRRTRLSAIDGSVQEYAVVEPAPSLAAIPTRVVVSLHGAGVDCVGQARSYSRRPGSWVLCPTNRRPFGFDWQDWGRRDAYETLDDAAAALGLDVRRVGLTGHSMGGHGTWHLAANDPDRFFAIAPSAGWASFDTYAGGPRPPTALDALWRGADRGSDTLALAANLAPLPTFVLHGTADDNVPLGQAELMLRTLGAAGGGPSHHFQDGAGHWWDGDAAAGVDCVDWPGIFDLFERADPAAPPPTKLDWTTTDPAVDSQHHWVRALRPLRYGEPLRVRAEWDFESSLCTVATENALRLNVSPPRVLPPWRLVVDGTQMDVSEPTAWIERSGDAWFPAPVRATAKSPERSGPLKRAFDRGFALVLPTGGDASEDRETIARVRYDALQWWYRGNGFADLALDTEVLEDPDRFAGRNLVLYGNADTNAAWSRVIGDDGPVRVRRGSVRVGDRAYAGDGLACFFVRPRADDDTSVAAALADTGARGCRLAMLHGLFVSGVGYPDYVAWGERTLSLGDGGVLAAGWFGADWALDGRGFLSFGGESAR